MARNENRVIGLDFTLSQLRALEPRSNRSVRRKGLRAAATIVKRRMRATVAVDRRDTKRAIHSGEVVVKPEQDSINIGIKLNARGSPASTVHLIEFGARHHRAQPFMRKSLASTQRAATERYASAVEEGIDRVAARAASQPGVAKR